MNGKERWNQDNVALFGFIKYPYPGPIVPEPEKHKPRPQWDKDFDHQASAEEEEPEEDKLDPGEERLFKDQFPGGQGDDKFPLGFDQEQLKQGVKVELEHTEDPEIALEIAMDHLTENPYYYEMLKDVDEHIDTPTKKEREQEDEREQRNKERDQVEKKPVQKRDQEKRTFVDGDEFEMMLDLANALFESGDSRLAAEVALSLWR